MTGFFLCPCAVWIVFGVWLTGNVNALEHFSTAWSTYVGGVYKSDRVNAVALDSGGNVYLGGVCPSGIQNKAGAPDLSSPGFVAKVSPGGALLWATDFPERDRYGNDEVLGLTAGTTRIFAVGSKQGSDADTGTYAFIEALDTSDGSLVWPENLIGDHSGTNAFNAVAVGADGCVYAVGHTTSLSNYGGTDALVVKYDPSGTVLWRRYLGGANADSARAVAVTPGGALYVAGETCSPGWVSLPASGTASPADPAGFLVKLNAASGAHLWSAYLTGTGLGDDTANALATGGADAPSVLFVGGKTSSATFLGSPDGPGGFVARLTDTGAAFTTNWCRFAGGSSGAVSSLGLLADGRIAAGGTASSGGWFTPVPGSETFHGARDGFVALLDAATGAPSWATCVGGAGDDRLLALAASSNTLLTAGDTFSTNWVGGGFWTEWNKDSLFNDGPASFGFAIKWEPGAPLPPALLLPAEPADRTAREGDPVTFTAAASGTAPLFYRWFRDGSPLPGATASNLAFTAAYADDGARYSCLVSNVAGTAQTRPALLTVIPMGALAVTLSPPGARWRLDDSPVWLPGGLTTNLPTGSYAVTFTNLVGWITPAPLPAVQVAHAATTAVNAAYTPILPEADRAVNGTNVTLTVRAPGGLDTWTLVETLPPGVTPASITPPGIWNPGAGTLTFTGTDASTNTLSYLAVCASSGVYTVSGTVTPVHASIPVPVSGDSAILNAKLIRAIDGTNVTITATVAATTGFWMIDEYLPSGLTPANIAGGLLVGNTAGHLTWVLSGVGVLSYTVSGDPGTYTLHGTGGTEPILGDTLLTIPGAEPPPRPDILALAPLPPGAFALTFTSAANRAYSILTNADLANPSGWASAITNVPGLSPATTVPVPASGPRLFYRVRALE